MEGKGWLRVASTFESGPTPLKFRCCWWYISGRFFFTYFISTADRRRRVCIVYCNCRLPSNFFHTLFSSTDYCTCASYRLIVCVRFFYNCCKMSPICRQRLNFICLALAYKSELFRHNVTSAVTGFELQLKRLLRNCDFYWVTQLK